MRAYIFQMIV